MSLPLIVRCLKGRNCSLLINCFLIILITVTRPTLSIPTVTVRGFLNFRTTVDGTVIVFTPASAIPSPKPFQPEATVISSSAPLPDNLITGQILNLSPSRTTHQPFLLSTADQFGPLLAQREDQQRSVAPLEYHSPIRPLQHFSSIESRPSSSIRRPPPIQPTHVIPLSIQTETTAAPAAPQLRTTIRRPTRLGSSRARDSRFTFTPPQTQRVRINRFKVKLGQQRATEQAQGGPVTRKDKQEEQAAREINSRLNRRLGANRPVVAPVVIAPSSTTEAAATGPSAFEGFITGDLLQGGANNGQPSFIDPEPVFRSPGSADEPQLEALRQEQPSEPAVGGGPFYAHPLVEPTLSGTDGNDIEGSTAGQETPPIVVSRTYTQTETSTRTEVVPWIEANSTAGHYTITESFLIEKLITAFRTIPASGPIELINSLINLNESLTLDPPKDLCSIQPTSTVLELPSSGPIVSGLDLNNLDSILKPSHDTSSNQLPLGQPGPLQGLPGQLGPIQNPIGPNVDFNNPIVLSSILQHPGLAAMYFALQQLNQQATIVTSVTRRVPTVTTETVFNTKAISFFDGRQTRTRTIIEPASTVPRTIETTTVDVSQILNPQVLVQQAQLQRAIAAQLATLAPQQPLPTQNDQLRNFYGFNQPQFNPLNQIQQLQIQPKLVESDVTTVISTTETKTKIYTLVYNAFSTKYRTVTSTSVYPTTVTTRVTSTIQPSSNFFFG